MTAAPRAGRRERNKAANRDAILDAARSCFLERGYDAVTVRDVIRRTRLAAGTFYNYFPDKESLFRALVEGRMRRLTAQLIDVRRHADTLEAFVHGAYTAAFTAVAEDPVLYHLLLRNESAVRHFYQQSVMGLSVGALKRDIRDATRRGLMPDLDAEYLAAALFGAGYEMGRILAERRRGNPGEAAAFAARLFLDGIRSFRRPESG